MLGLSQAPEDFAGMPLPKIERPNEGGIAAAVPRASGEGSLSDDIA